MATRWHPDTCDGFDQGKGCILDVDEWGPNGDTPTGTIVQQCARHATLSEAHQDNLLASTVKAVASSLPSLATKLMMTVEGNDLLPASEVLIVFDNNIATITLPHASAEDRLAVQTMVDLKFPGKAMIT